MLSHKTIFFSIAAALILSACSSKKPEEPQQAAEKLQEAATHLGGCVLLSPTGAVPDDLYQVGEVTATDEYKPFTKKLMVYGIVLIGRDDIKDDFMHKVAKTIMEMFPQQDGINLKLQQELLRNHYRYRAVIPLFKGHDYEFSPADEADWDRTRSENSICDIIMQDVPGQVMEVVEHILHHVSDVGLHFTFPDEWGISRTSKLYHAMQEAIEKGYYVVDQYDDVDEEEVKDRVLMQEFAYWVITSAWDLQNPYGPDAEWKKIRTPDDLKTMLPSSYQLFEETIPMVMVSPSISMLEEFKEYDKKDNR
jgi:hypothetical protein